MARIGYIILNKDPIHMAILDIIRTQNFRLTIGLIAGILSIIEFVPYIYSIIRGRTRPERATWFIWTLITILGFTTYYLSGGRSAIWLPLGYAINTIITTILSIKYGVGGWNIFDKIILGSVGLCLFVWFISGSALLALVMTIIVDLLAALPTIKKTYYHPEQEDRLAWIISLSANGLNLFAIEKFDLAHAAYPLYLFLMSGTILGLILKLRRVRLRR